MPGTVTTNQLTNVTNAEAADSGNWDDTSGGGGSGQDDNGPIQGSENRSRRIDNVSDRGFSFDDATGQDISAQGWHVGWWIKSVQPALTTSFRVTLSDAATFTASAWSGWIIFSTGGTPYPPDGAWQRVWLDPHRYARDEGTGTLDMTAVRNWGIITTMGNVGGAADNIHCDRIDRVDALGGLLVDAGTGGDPATFQDFVDADEGNSSNQYGVVQSRAGIVFCLARLTIADATLTVFNDDGFAVVFANQSFVSPEFMGITVDLQNSSTDVDFANGLIRSGGTVNKGDFRVVDTGGAFDADTTTFDGLRRILVSGADSTFATCTFAACGQLDLTNSDYSGFVDLPGTDEYVESQETFDLNSASGDFEVIILVDGDDFGISGTGQNLLGQDDGTDASFQLFYTRGTGNITLRLTVYDGTGSTQFDGSSLSPPQYVQSHSLWIRATYDHSAGAVNFYTSRDPVDTPSGDVSWTAAGTPTGTARLMPSNALTFMIGAIDSSSPTGFFDGKVRYAEFWNDGFRAPGSDHGDLILRADWRTGPDFDGSDTRVDDFDGSNLTWELFGTAPTYTTADANTDAADIGESSISNNTSESALVWNINADPDGELDNTVWTSTGTGHAIELGPNTPVTITLRGHNYTSYAGSDGSTGDEVLYNNSNKSITVNIAGDGDIPTVRNGTGASTTVSVTYDYDLTNLIAGSEVRVFRTSDMVELAGIESSGTTFQYQHDGTVVGIYVIIMNNSYEWIRINDTLGAANTSQKVFQRFDRNYENP